MSRHCRIRLAPIKTDGTINMIVTKRVILRRNNRYTGVLAETVAKKFFCAVRAVAVRSPEERCTVLVKDVGNESS